MLYQYMMADVEHLPFNINHQVAIPPATMAITSAIQ